MLIDSHCHIFDEKYENKTQKLLNEAQEFEVSKVITIGTSLEDSKELVNKIVEFENVFGTIGIYPQNDVDIKIETLIKNLEKIYKNSKKIVALGELGIDLVENMQRNKTDQIELFEAQLALASKLNLPVVIHNRNGTDIVYDILKKFQLKGVLHCFVDDWDTAKKFLDLGYFISFSGIITYKSGETIHETVKNVPSDRYLVETDAPYLAPQGFRNKVNEPKYVKMVAEKVAEIRNSSFSAVCEESSVNTTNLFGLNKF